MDEAVIRQRIERGVSAIRAKDIEGVMSLYAPDVVAFDVSPPLQYVGIDDKRRAWSLTTIAFIVGSLSSRCSI